MFYIGCLIFGIVLITLSGIYFCNKRDYLGDLRERYNIYIGTKDITVSTPGGVSLGLVVSRTDQEVAWRIYTQLTTRVAVVDFNESYDSFLLVNESLYLLFGEIREQLSQIPVQRIRRDKNDEMVKFYMSILNDGIRPYLSKWHMPIAKWIEIQKKTHPGLTNFEIEKSFHQRKEILEDMKSMNLRMKAISEQLLKIVKVGK